MQADMAPSGTSNAGEKKRPDFGRARRCLGRLNDPAGRLPLRRRWGSLGWTSGSRPLTYQRDGRRFCGEPEATSVAGRRATQTDGAVGQRIGEFRKDANLSQTELADQIGVTYQQLQKYENGTNRVGSGRLLHIARALDVPITAFFDGLARPTDKRGRALTARVAELTRLPAAR